VDSFDNRLFDKLERTEALARELGRPMSQYALAWTLTQPAIASPIVGVKRLDQIEDAVAAAAVKLPTEHLKQLDTICSPPWKQHDPIRG